MKRRGVLALLTPFLAGCFGGGAVRGTRTAEPTETDASTPTATPAPTATSTPESTATPTPEPTATPTGDGERTAEYLRTARERVGTAVEKYAGDGDLTDVRADAEEFVASDVYVALTRANASVGRAAALAATDDQEMAVERLRGVVTFLSRATAAQANVVEGYDALVAARTTLADDTETGTNGHLRTVRAAREAVDNALSHVESESDPSDTEAVDAVDADAYRAKVEQFEAEAGVLEDAREGVSTLSNGLVLLRTARTRGENGDEDSAAEDAEEAVEKLDSAATAFGEVLDDLPDAAEAFESPLESYEEFAVEKRAEAEDLVAQYG